MSGVSQPAVHPRTRAARVKWKTRGSMGEFMMLSKHDLRVDHTYQRDERKKRALDYAANWSWVACGAVSVALREVDGKVEFWVMDGQTRVGAALMRDDITQLPCLCFDVDSVADEALGFYEINQHRGQPSSADKYKALLVAGDPVAVEVQRLIHNYSDRTVARYSASTTVSCVGALMRCMAIDRDRLERIFPLIVGLVNGEHFHRDLVWALFWLEGAITEGSLTDDKWTKRLRNLGFKKLRAAIDETSAYLGKRTGRSAGIGVMRLINSGLRLKLEITDTPSNTEMS
jgi:hypothetical protein